MIVKLFDHPHICDSQDATRTLTQAPTVRRAIPIGATRSHTGSRLCAAFCRHLPRTYHQLECKRTEVFRKRVVGTTYKFFDRAICTTNIAAFVRNVREPISKRAYSRRYGANLRTGRSWIAQRTPFTNTIFCDLRRWFFRLGWGLLYGTPAYPCVQSVSKTAEPAASSLLR